MTTPHTCEAVYLSWKLETVAILVHNFHIASVLWHHTKAMHSSIDRTTRWRANLKPSTTSIPRVMMLWRRSSSLVQWVLWLWRRWKRRGRYWWRKGRSRWQLSYHSKMSKGGRGVREGGRGREGEEGGGCGSELLSEGSRLFFPVRRSPRWSRKVLALSPLP